MNEDVLFFSWIDKHEKRIVSLIKYGIIWLLFNFIGIYLITFALKLNLDLYVWGTIFNLVLGLGKYILTDKWKVF